MAHKQNTTRKAALVTGAGKRMGSAIARMLAEEGYDIALHCHTSMKEAKATADAIRKCGVRCEVFTADLRKGGYQTLMQKVFKTFPNLTLLINNASLFERKAFMETTEADYDANMAVHLKAPLFLTQEFSRKVKKGQVLNIVDTYVTKTTPAYFAYLLSKKALYEFTRMAARALSPNIRVNAVAPGTTLQSKDMSAQHRKKKEATLPMAALIEFNDVVEAVRFIINQPKITGECLFVDSGEQLL
ncbi:MAG: SDR family oxidoreductase [Proteobacteria bacterium]|nr:SDR family oxidoreductase [Pseudomonadota bacterium]